MHKVWKACLLVIVSFAVLLLGPPVIGQARELPTKGLLAANATIVDANGKTVSHTAELPEDQEYMVKYTWTMSEWTRVKAGDTFQVYVPANVRIPEDISFDMVNTKLGNKTIGTFFIAKNSHVGTVTLNDVLVTNRYNRKGYINLAVTGTVPVDTGELEVPGVTNPENPLDPGFVNPGNEGPGTIGPSTPGTPGTGEPSNPSTTPETPGTEEPSNPGTTPENPGTEEPSNPGTTPETPGTEEPSNPGTTPETPGTEEPSKPGTTPETPVTTNPSTPGDNEGNLNDSDVAGSTTPPTIPSKPVAPVKPSPTPEQPLIPDGGDGGGSGTSTGTPNPVKPTAPNKPEKPNEPEAPNKPEKPNKPNRPTVPNKPVVAPAANDNQPVQSGAGSHAVSNGHPVVAGSTAVASSSITTTEQPITTIQQSSALPQTNEHQSPLAMILGVALLIGASAWGIYRHK